MGQGPQTSDSDLGLAFRPTEAMAKVKARYRLVLADRPLVGGKVPTLALAQQLTGSAAIKGWWDRPGFREWFLNERTVEERLEWLQELSLGALEDILLNTDPKAQGARLNAAKLVAEMTGRTARAPKDDPEARKRKAIDAMSKEELTQLLESQGINIQKVVSLDVGTEIKD